ncbi:MAG TPA: ABC transporter ATP-binding protein [Deinococcales bacterium]|nr:ABC transporter ATP-binding protein [Deinococcales bacterium]
MTGREQAGGLRLENVSKTFSGTKALHGFTLEFRPGAINTLLGPSGCGKTTALRICAGFLEADGGRVLLDGREQAGRPPFRRDIAMVFQDFALFPHLNVEQNVGYGLRFRRLSPAERRERTGSLLEFLQLDRLAGRLPHELSGGQQQRVALGRALAVRPRVLLMDEPFSNLDTRLRAHVRGELRAIQQELGVTTVFVTHDHAEALSLSDFVAVMRAGRLLQAGEPRELYLRPQSRFVADALGEANFLPVSAVQPAGNGQLSVTVAGRKLLLSRPAGGVPDEPLLLVRPAGFTLGLRAADDTFTGTLLRREYQGAREQLFLSVPDLPAPLQVEVPAGQPLPEEGGELHVGLAPDAGVLVAGVS